MQWFKRMEKVKTSGLDFILSVFSNLNGSTIIFYYSISSHHGTGIQLEWLKMREKQFWKSTSWTHQSDASLSFSVRAKGRTMSLQYYRTLKKTQDIKHTDAFPHLFLSFPTSYQGMPLWPHFQHWVQPVPCSALLPPAQELTCWVHYSLHPAWTPAAALLLCLLLLGVRTTGEDHLAPVCGPSNTHCHLEQQSTFLT